MSRARGKLAITKALQRRSGMAPDKRENMEASMNRAEDWRGTCSVCKAQLVGSLTQLMRHSEGGQCNP